MTESEQSSHLHDDERIPRTTRTTPQGMLELADELDSWPATGRGDGLDAAVVSRLMKRAAAALRLSASPAGNGGRELASHGIDRKPLWILKFEDADRDDIHFKHEADAHRAYEGYSVTWNCTLFETSVRKYELKRGILLALTPAVAPDGAREEIDNLIKRLEYDDMAVYMLDPLRLEAARMLRRLSGARPAVVGIEGRDDAPMRDALQAVWDDWTTAHDCSGAEEYEIKDVAPETVALVKDALARHPHQPVEDKR